MFFTQSPLTPQHVNINTLISHPISEDQDPQLQAFAKILKQYMDKCVKNREYIQAQKAKDKIQEVQRCIKRRNNNHVDEKLNENKRRLLAKHQAQKQQFFHKWNTRIGECERKHNEIAQKKLKQHEQQIVRFREQAQLALPQSFSPDDKLKTLRQAERQLAKQGKFMEAQKVKQQIQQKQLQMQQKHRRIRQANIKSMLSQIQVRFEKDLKQRDLQKKTAIGELIDERNWKFEQLQKRQNRQLRQNKWMHDEQKKIKKI